GEFARPGASAEVQRCLGGSVRGSLGQTEGDEAGDVDDAAPALLGHSGQDCLGQLYGGADVQVVDGQQVVQVHFGQQGVADDPDVVDQGVDGAALQDVVEGARGGGAISEVHGVELAGEFRWSGAGQPDRMVAVDVQTIGHLIADAS